MDYTEAIMEIKNVVHPKFIEKIISLVDHKSNEKLKIKGGFDINIRNVNGYHLN